MLQTPHGVYRTAFAVVRGHSILLDMAETIESTAELCQSHFAARPLPLPCSRQLPEAAVKRHLRHIDTSAGDSHLVR